MNEPRCVAVGYAQAHEHDHERDVSLLAIDQYFRELKCLPRLSPDEERACFEHIARGKEEQAKACPEALCVSLAREARSRLAETYQPFVVYLARRLLCYARRMELSDLIQEGSIGLLEAIDRNDLTSPYPFRALAATCVRHAMVKALQADGMFHSEWMSNMLSKVRKAARQFERQHGTEPALSELAAVVQEKEEVVSHALAFEHVQDVESLQGLFARVAEDGDEDVLHLVGLYEPAPGGATERQALLREKVRMAVELLPPQQQRAVRLYYGLDGEAVKGCEEIACCLGCGLKGAEKDVKLGRDKLAQMFQLGVQAGEVTYEVRPLQVPCAQRSYYTCQEVREKLGCSQDALYRWVREGKVPKVLFEGYKAKAVYAKEVIDALAVQRGRGVAV